VRKGNWALDGLGQCDLKPKGHFHADATFSVSTLNYRNSRTPGNINVDTWKLPFSIVRLGFPWCWRPLVQGRPIRDGSARL